MKAVAPPHDQAARTEIRTRLDVTRFVEAGAGTGKTTALVARILELVCSGEVTINRLAAITFTEAAAAELRDRVYEALERAVAVSDERGGTGDVAGPADVERAERRTRARAALDEIESAAICTLHGFARRILAAHPFEAGLPPVFDVLDPGRSAVAFDDRWEIFVDQLLGDPGLQDVVLRLLVCGVKIDHLRSMAERCNDNWDLVPNVEPGVQSVDLIEAGSILGSLEAAGAKADFCISTDDKLWIHIQGLVEFQTALRSSNSELETLQLVVNAPKLKCRQGQKGNWQWNIAEVRDLLDQADVARQTLLAGVISDALFRVLSVIMAFTLESARERQREGRLEFHDLLALSLALVRNDAEVCGVLHREYQRLLIDEFQDTDPIQAEIAVRIAHGAAHAGHEDEPWIQLDVEPGRLFFVGDPKQAIYRFRRADIGLFLDVRQQHQADLVALTGNFRSVPRIIDWVNTVFNQLFDDGIEGVQPAYEALHAERPNPAGDAGAMSPVVLLGHAIDEGTMGEVRIQEAREMASTIRRIRDEKWPVGDSGVPARLSDITVLIPTRTGLPILQRVFDDEGVPYRLESSSLVYEAPEVCELLTILKAIDDPTDQISTVAALRSAAFGCGDDDLLGYHQAGGSWDYRNPAPSSWGQGNPVVAGMADLDQLHRERWWRDVSGLVELVIKKRRLLELGLGARRTRDVWRRLRFVADQARLFTDTHGGDLRRYLLWVDVQRRDDVRAVEVVLPETDDDAVRVMTVHGAKGLEFPIVFLSGLNRTASRRRDVNVLWGAVGPEVKIRDGICTHGYEDLEAQEQLMEGAQDLRLLYVAATRACDYLIVNLHHAVGKACDAARLLAICNAHPELWRRLDPTPTTAGPGREVRVGEIERERPVRFSTPLLTVVDERVERNAWIADHQRLVTSGALSRTLAATTVAELAQARDAGISGHGVDARPPFSSVDRAKEDSDIDLPPWRRGRAGTSIGRAVHAVLQSVDMATGVDVHSLAEAQAVAEGVDTRSGEIAGLVRAALGSDIVREAVAGGRYWREMYVGVPATDEPGGPVIEGFIDLLIESADGFTVVDYKTDAVHNDEQRTQAMDRYRMQGATYALAVERALGRPVSRCVFLFLRDSPVTQQEVPELRAAMDDVKQLVRAVSTADPPVGI